jgi:hypothetical protein
VKSNAEIRQVLIDFDKTGSNLPIMFTRSEIVKSGEDRLYDGLDKDGTAVVMNIEMNKELKGDANVKCAKKGDSKGKSGGKKEKGGNKKK